MRHVGATPEVIRLTPGNGRTRANDSLANIFKIP